MISFHGCLAHRAPIRFILSSAHDFKKNSWKTCPMSFFSIWSQIFAPIEHFENFWVKNLNLGGVPFVILFFSATAVLRILHSCVVCVRTVARERLRSTAVRTHTTFEHTHSTHTCAQCAQYMRSLCVRTCVRPYVCMCEHVDPSR